MYRFPIRGEQEGGQWPSIADNYNVLLTPPPTLHINLSISPPFVTRLLSFHRDCSTKRRLFVQTLNKFNDQISRSYINRAMSCFYSLKLFQVFYFFAVNTSWRKMVSKLVPYSFLDFSLQYLYVYHVWMCFEENALFSSCEGVHANVCSWLGWKHFEVLRLGLVFSDPAQPADRGAELGNVVGNCANICRAQRGYWWSTCSISLSYINYWIWCKYWYSLKLKVGVHGLKNVLKLSFSS